MSVLRFLILGALLAWTPAAAAGLDPVVEALLEMWDEADLVCLGEDHGDPDDHALRMALVSHPDFPRTVRVVVVEFVNPVHQELLDRWVVEGEELPRERQRALWRDAGMSVVWDLPMYEELLRTVREINLGLDAGDRVRVVGGAAPIPWNRVTTAEDLVPWLDRGRWIVDAVRREVLDPGRRGLAIFGAGHCERSGMGFPARLTAEELRRTQSVFGFFGAGGRAAAREALGAGPGPEWIQVRGSLLAGMQAGTMLFEGHDRTALGELADALVYLPPGPAGPVADAAVADPSFEREVARRWRLLEQAQTLDRAGNPVGPEVVKTLSRPSASGARPCAPTSDGVVPSRCSWPPAARPRQSQAFPHSKRE